MTFNEIKDAIMCGAKVTRKVWFEKKPEYYFQIDMNFMKFMSFDEYYDKNFCLPLDYLDGDDWFIIEEK